MIKYRVTVDWASEDDDGTSDYGTRNTMEEAKELFQTARKKEKEIAEGKVKQNVAEIVIAKHRNGPTGVVELYFKSECTKFVNVNRETGEPVDGEQQSAPQSNFNADGFEDLPTPTPEEAPVVKSIDDEIF